LLRFAEDILSAGAVARLMMGPRQPKISFCRGANPHDFL
jgi:hypothetical protein